MMLHPFSAVLFFYIIKIIYGTSSLSKKFIHLLVISSTIGILNLRGYFFSLNGAYYVSYSMACSVCMALFSLYYIARCRIRLQFASFGLGAAFLAALLLSGVLNIGFPYHEPVYSSISSWDGWLANGEREAYAELRISRYVYLFFGISSFAITLLLAKHILSKNDIAYIIKKMNVILRCYVAYIGVEAIVKNLLETDLLNPVLDAFFGNDEDMDAEAREGDIRGTFYALCGFSSEPSWLGFSLFYIMVFFVLQHLILQEPYKARDKIYMGFILLLQFVGGAFTHVLAWCALALLYLYLTFYGNARCRLTMKFLCRCYVLAGILGGLSIAALFLWRADLWSQSYLLEKLEHVYTFLPLILEGRLTIPSGMVSNGGFSVFSRLFSNIYAYSHALERPLLGLGLGFIVPHGGVSMALSNIGFFGCFLWWQFCFSFHKYRRGIFLITVVFLNLFHGNLVVLMGSTFLVVLIESLRRDILQNI